MSRHMLWSGLAITLTALNLVMLWQDRVSAQAAKEPSAPGLEKRLQLVTETQQQILEKLDAVLEELKVVKIRCTP